MQWNIESAYTYPILVAHPHDSPKYASDRLHFALGFGKLLGVHKQREDLFDIERFDCSHVTVEVMELVRVDRLYRYIGKA